MARESEGDDGMIEIIGDQVKLDDHMVFKAEHKVRLKMIKDLEGTLKRMQNTNLFKNEAVAVGQNTLQRGHLEQNSDNEEQQFFIGRHTVSQNHFQFARSHPNHHHHHKDGTKKSPPSAMTHFGGESVKSSQENIYKGSGHAGNYGTRSRSKVQSKQEKSIISFTARLPNDKGSTDYL